MKQLLLATTLIAVPVIGFTIVEMLLPAGSAVSATSGTASLGDLSSYETIVADTRALAESGDLVGAETRITDLEVQWDDAEATMRPKAPDAWGNVDAAADDSFSALRASKPDPGKVLAALTALSTVLADPSGGAAGGTVGTVGGIAVTDANGHPLPCEMMLSDVYVALAEGSIADADRPAADDFQGRAMERCNADDDTRANVFSASALALAKH